MDRITFQKQTGLKLDAGLTYFIGDWEFEIVIANELDVSVLNIELQDVWRISYKDLMKFFNNEWISRKPRV